MRDNQIKGNLLRATAPGTCVIAGATRRWADRRTRRSRVGAQVPRRRAAAHLRLVSVRRHDGHRSRHRRGADGRRRGKMTRVRLGHRQRTICRCSTKCYSRSARRRSSSSGSTSSPGSTSASRRCRREITGDKEARLHARRAPLPHVLLYLRRQRLVPRGARAVGRQIADGRARERACNAATRRARGSYAGADATSCRAQPLELRRAQLAGDDADDEIRRRRWRRTTRASPLYRAGFPRASTPSPSPIAAAYAAATRTNVTAAAPRRTCATSSRPTDDARASSSPPSSPPPRTADRARRRARRECRSTPPPPSPPA